MHSSEPAVTITRTHKKTILLSFFFLLFFFFCSVGDHLEQVWPFIFAICYFWKIEFKAKMYIKDDQQQ